MYKVAGNENMAMRIIQAGVDGKIDKESQQMWKESRLNCTFPFFSKVMRLLSLSPFKPHGSSSNTSLPSRPCCSNHRVSNEFIPQSGSQTAICFALQTSCQMSDWKVECLCVYMKAGYPSPGLSAHDKSDLIVQCLVCVALHPVRNLRTSVLTNYYYSKCGLRFPFLKSLLWTYYKACSRTSHGIQMMVFKKTKQCVVTHC